MRTTLTLETDVSAGLRQEMRHTGKSLKQLVNEYLRLGLQNRKHMTRVPPFKVHPFPAGPPPGMSFDRVDELVEYLEGPLHS